jgi:hypothetical protein
VSPLRASLSGEPAQTLPIFPKPPALRSRRLETLHRTFIEADRMTADPADNTSSRENCGFSATAPQSGTAMDRRVNVLALVKDGERYVFLYDDRSLPQLLQTLGKFAADPELSFSWYDAAVLSQKVRRLQQIDQRPSSMFRESA